MNNITMLKKYALNYLSKYDTSKKNLERILRNKIRRINLEKNQKFILYNSITSILIELEFNKFINDTNYTKSKINYFSLQGKSKRFIISYLLEKGIEKELINETFNKFESENPEWEIESAKIFARKKRLGMKDTKNKEKDLAKMSRAGFNYNICKKTLGLY